MLTLFDIEFATNNSHCQNAVKPVISRTGLNVKLYQPKVDYESH